MPTTWFTADTHLGHANIVKFCLRPFLTPAEEEQALMAFPPENGPIVVRGSHPGEARKGSTNDEEDPQES